MLPTPDDDQLWRIDVSASLVYTPPEGTAGDPMAAKRRVLYPKFGASTLLDGLLSSRLNQLKADGGSVIRVLIRGQAEPAPPPVEEDKEEEAGDKPDLPVVPFPDIETDDPEIDKIVAVFKQKAAVVPEFTSNPVSQDVSSPSPCFPCDAFSGLGRVRIIAN
jgi:hypothetical protein